MEFVHHFRAREGLLAVSAGAALWGTNGVIVRFVGNHSALSAVSIGFYRLLFASAVLVVFFGKSAVELWRTSSAHGRALLLATGVSLGGYQALYFAAIGNVGISVSTLVSIGVAPLAIMIGQAAVRRRRPATRSLVIVALALGGLALISLSAGTGSARHPLLGIIEAIGSGLGYVTLLEPLTATGLAVFIVHERLPAAGVLGALLMLGAIGVLYAGPQAPVPDSPMPPANIVG
jgi:DME family drug/metabolite transporter